MRTIYTHTGWDEIITKKITVLSIAANPLMTAQQWLSANQNIGRKDRTCCDRCKTRWDDIHGLSSVWIVFTDKGNKAVCDKCKEQVEIQLSMLLEEAAANIEEPTA